MSTKREQVYLSVFEELFVLSRAGYKRYLKAIADNGSADISDYGKSLGIVSNVTDIDRQMASTIVGGGRCSHLPTI